MAAEQDDDLLDNWEDIEENPAVLEKHLEKLSVKNSQSQSQPAVQSTPVLTCEDNSRTPFTATEPKIMILKRPQEKIDSSANGLINRQKQPVKSLEQRQQEYAEARLRILGDAGSTEEKPKPIQQKSLEQREADYAAARLRIMGSASKSVEEPMVSGSSGGGSVLNLQKDMGTNVGVLRAPGVQTALWGLVEGVAETGGKRGLDIDDEGKKIKITAEEEQETVQEREKE